MFTEDYQKAFELNPVFEKAVYIGDTEKVKEMCQTYKENGGQCKFDINKIVGILPPIYHAAYNQRWEMVRDLLDAGADINIVTTAHKEDFLATLIRLKDVPKDIWDSVVKQQEEEGNFQFKNTEGMNYLMLAIKNQSFNMFEQLYQKEVIATSAIDKEHNHLLHYLAKGGPHYYDYFLDASNKNKFLLGRFNKANESAFDFIEDETFKNSFSDMMDILAKQDRQKIEMSEIIAKKAKENQEELESNLPEILEMGDFKHPSINKIKKAKM